MCMYVWNKFLLMGLPSVEICEIVIRLSLWDFYASVQVMIMITDQNKKCFYQIL